MILASRDKTTASLKSSFYWGFLYSHVWANARSINRLNWGSIWWSWFNYRSNLNLFARSKIREASAKAFFIERGDKEKEARQAELFRHYKTMEDSVLREWIRATSSLSFYENYRGEELAYPSVDLYLHTSLEVADTFSHRRIFRHLQAPKYKTVLEILQQIYELEDNHNISASMLILRINQDVGAMLSKFGSLLEWTPELTQGDYYHKEEIVGAILRSADNVVIQKPYIYQGGSPFAMINSDGERNIFHSRIVQLVEIYRSKLKDLRLWDKDRMDLLLLELRNSILPILDEIDIYKHFDGECDFEMNITT